MCLVAINPVLSPSVNQNWRRKVFHLIFLSPVFFCFSAFILSKQTKCDKRSCKACCSEMSAKLCSAPTQAPDLAAQWERGQKEAEHCTSPARASPRDSCTGPPVAHAKGVWKSYSSLSNQGIPYPPTNQHSCNRGFLFLSFLEHVSTHGK